MQAKKIMQQKQVEETYTLTLNINMHCSQCISIQQDIMEIALLNSVFKCNHSVTTNTTNRKRIPWVDNSICKKYFPAHDRIIRHDWQNIGLCNKTFNKPVCFFNYKNSE